MPDLNSAKVEVTFQDIIDTGDGPEDYEVVKGSVLTVTREAQVKFLTALQLSGLPQQPVQVLCGWQDQQLH